jgi:hypothetical protein
MDRSQRVGPGRDPDRDIRVHDRCDAVPTEPRTGSFVSEVPRTDRVAAVPGDVGAYRRHVLSVLACSGHDDAATRHAHRDVAHRDGGAGRLHDGRRSADRGLHARVGTDRWDRVGRSRIAHGATASTRSVRRIQQPTRPRRRVAGRPVGSSPTMCGAVAVQLHHRRCGGGPRCVRAS